MAEGYLICKKGRRAVEQTVKATRLLYDEELSNTLKLSVFWYEGIIPKKELEEKAEGKFFSLDEIVVFGVKYCSEYVDLKKAKG